MTQVSRFERLWSIEETAHYLGVAVKTLYQWRWKRPGPAATGSAASCATGLVRSRPGSTTRRCRFRAA